MNDRGFTLVELLIALLIGGIVMGSVMTSFRSQHRTYLSQDQVVEMRQNARVAMDMLVRDIRMAGYDPQGVGAGITNAQLNQFQFTRPATRRNSTARTIISSGPISFLETLPGLDSWRAGDLIIADAVGAADTLMRGTVTGITNTAAGATINLNIVSGQGSGTFSNWTLTNLDRLETVRFMLYDLFDGPLGLGRARADDVADLTNEPVAENIEQLAFRYLDGSGNVTAAPADIRTIQVAILARAAVDDPSYNHALTYNPWAGLVWNPPNDGRRRLLLTQTVLCRNLGL